MIILLLVLGVVFAVAGRLLFGRWFNHATLYSAFWTFSLALFGIQLIHYYPVDVDTWFYVLGGWCAFMLGSSVVASGRFALGTLGKSGKAAGSARYEQVSDDTVRFVGHVLWILSVLTLLDAIYQVKLLVGLVGSLSNIFALANVIYSSRIGQGLPGAIPYLSSIALTASLLAGAYASMVGKLRFIVLLPIIVVIIDSIVNMGRSTMIISAVLFLSGYFMNRFRRRERVVARRGGRAKRLIAVLCVIAVLVSGIELVRSNRGTIEGFSAATQTLNKLGGIGFITPSVYMYLTVHFAVFNKYLKADEEHDMVGGYSLAPMWRILYKAGFDSYVPQYQPFYSTPVVANTGTYLRELHADYGPLGVIFGPFLLGMISSIFWYRLQERHSFFDAMVFGHILVVDVMSIFFLATLLGYWLVSLLVGMIAARMLDGHRRTDAARMLRGLA